jgi:hypothetical protein
MARYIPGESTLLYEEDGYRVVGNLTCLMIQTPKYFQASAGHKVEEVPPQIEKKLIQEGKDPKDFFYVPYILIKAEARASVEEFVRTLKEHNQECYTRAVLPHKMNSTGSESRTPPTTPFKSKRKAPRRRKDNRFFP